MLIGSVLATIGLAISLVQMIVILQFVLFLLLTFNVVSMQNRIVSNIWNALSTLIDPLLAPIRRLMPPMGGIDFSPMVLIFGLGILGRIVGTIAYSGY